ncbi:MAG: tetratricopeptide repeat protein [Acidobacteriota bacterium]|nr:tetratricopeptide repeat protein [Acidobacteriota bacterium]
MIRWPGLTKAKTALRTDFNFIWLLIFILLVWPGLVYSAYAWSGTAAEGASIAGDISNPVNNGLRQIRVQLLADDDLNHSPEAMNRVESSLAEISDEFESLFGLTFIPAGWSSWEADKGSHNIQELVEKSNLFLPGKKADLVLAVTARTNLQPEYSGLALFRNSVVIIVYTSDRTKLRKLIKHEFGHVFGAVHVPEPASVMSCSGKGDDFDASNQAIIKLMRERSFESLANPFPLDIRMHVEKTYLQIRENIRQLSQVKPLLAPVPAGEASEQTRCLSDVFLMLAQIELEKNDYQRAINFCEEALRLAPSDLEAMNLQAVSFRQAGRLQEAVNLYKLILDIKPDSSDALYNLGIALSQLNQFAEAEKAYLEAIRINPYLAQARHNLGDLYFKQGRLDEAEEQFFKAIEIFPAYTSAYLNLGEIYWREKNGQKARQYAEKALSLEPESSQAMNLLGNILRQSGKPDEAIGEYQKALERAPESAQVYYNLGISLIDLGRWTEARNCFEQAIKINFNMAEAYGGLGLCYLHEGEMKEAIRFLLKARELGFKDPALSVNLSYAYLNIKDWQKAEEEARQGVALQPGLSLAYNNLGIALAQQNKFEEARTVLEKALNLDPQDVEAVINLAMVELSLKNEERALELFLKALALDPEDSQKGLIDNNIAVIYYHQGKYHLSWEFAQKALQAGFKVNEAWLNDLKEKLN